MDSLLNNLNKEDRMLIRNIIDKYKKYEKSKINTYTNFLDMREYKLATDILKKLKIEFNSYITSSDCEKSIIYFGEYNNFVTIYKIDIEGITHRDVLGTLFSLGYEPNIIGDIFVLKDKVYITNLTRLNSFLENSLYMIKNKRVNLEIVDHIEINEDRFIDMKIVVPSYRLDAIVSKLAHLSRNDVNKYIRDKLVLLNYIEVANPNKIVSIGDVISIRKVGKFIISEEIAKSKKDNIFLIVKKYN